jgi:hypothetical protein
MTWKCDVANISFTSERKGGIEVDPSTLSILYDQMLYRSDTTIAGAGAGYPRTGR